MVGFAVRKYQLFSLTPEAAAETILAAMTDPLLLTDKEGKAVRANQAFIKFMGLSNKSIQQKSFRKLLSESNFRPTIDFPENPNFDNREIILKNYAGDEKYVQISCSNVLDSNNETVGIVHFLHDVTELRHMQLRLLKSERFAAIGELAGMVGHDLRNPLTGIKNSIYFLKKKGKALPEAEVQELYSIIDRCINHSNKIINNLLDYSKEINLKLEENSIRNLLNESLYMINIPERIEFKNLTSEKKIKVDKEKIERVFLNFMKNAIDAMPDNGKLTVIDKEVAGNIEISFIDTGTGISSEVLPNLFSPLFTTKAQGTGLGLAACKRIIDAHKGEITVKTEICKGSTFKVILPLHQEMQTDLSRISKN
jgi:two-component system sensor histidine kinase HydH